MTRILWTIDGGDLLHKSSVQISSFSYGRSKIGISHSHWWKTKKKSWVTIFRNSCLRVPYCVGIGQIEKTNNGLFEHQMQLLDTVMLFVFIVTWFSNWHKSWEFQSETMNWTEYWISGLLFWQTLMCRDFRRRSKQMRRQNCNYVY